MNVLGILSLERMNNAHLRVDADKLDKVIVKSYKICPFQSSHTFHEYFIRRLRIQPWCPCIVGLILIRDKRSHVLTYTAASPVIWNNS